MKCLKSKIFICVQSALYQEFFKVRIFMKSELSRFKNRGKMIIVSSKQKFKISQELQVLIWSMKIMARLQ